MWEVEHKESWVLKNWCFWTVMLEKALESPLDCKEINCKGNQPWIFFGKTDAEVEAPITLATWCEELNHQKRPWCWEKMKARGEGEDRGWDGWMASLNQWTWVWASSGSWSWTGKPGVPPWGGKELDTTERLNWAELNLIVLYLLFQLLLLKWCTHRGLPRWPSGKDSTCQCRRHGFSPWSGMIQQAVESPGHVQLFVTPRVTESKLAVLATWQANESERQGVEARKGL